MKKRHKAMIFLSALSFLLLLVFLLVLLFACREEKHQSGESEEKSSDVAPSFIASEEQPTVIGTTASKESITETSALETEEQTKAPDADLPLDSAEITYTVSLFDHLNQPFTQEITVKLICNGTLAATQTAKNGIASFSLFPDVYTVELEIDDGIPFLYATEHPIRMSEYASSVSIQLHNRLASVFQTVNAYSTKSKSFRDFEAMPISVGLNKITAKENERTYLLFTPSEEGTYEIALDSEHALLLGYFGDALFAQKDSLAEPTRRNKFALTVKEDNLGMTYLFGITSSAEDPYVCTLSIARIGNVAPDIADMPYTQIKAENLPTADFHAHITSLSTVTNLDITAPDLQVVFNEEDSFYHLGQKDGPTVYLRIASKSPYLDSLKTMSQRTGLGRYFYDKNGNFERKEQYNQLFLEYAEIADPIFGLVPLNEELASAVKNLFVGMEWGKFGSPNYLFGSSTLSPDTAWLFAACTVSP